MMYFIDIEALDKGDCVKYEGRAVTVTSCTKERDDYHWKVRAVLAFPTNEDATYVLSFTIPSGGRMTRACKGCGVSLFTAKHNPSVHHAVGCLNRTRGTEGTENASEAEMLKNLDEALYALNRARGYWCDKNGELDPDGDWAKNGPRAAIGPFIELTEIRNLLVNTMNLLDPGRVD